GIPCTSIVSGGTAFIGSTLSTISSIINIISSSFLTTGGLIDGSITRNQIGIQISENLSNNPSPLKNVIVFMMGKDQWRFWKSHHYEIGQWHFIVASNINDARREIIKY